MSNTAAKGFIKKSSKTPRYYGVCVIVNVWPAIARVPERVLPELLGKRK